ncbi:MAG: EF-hand domain-containing protein [Parvibaculaceae bacterium]|nr:EF-hand domain-containing protein [Parvibaculaceae bacterium]
MKNTAKIFAGTLIGAAILSAGVVMANPMGGPRHHNPDAFFERFDANEDGAVSKEEFTNGKASHDKKLEKVDANKDGVLSKDEMRAHMLERFEKRFEKRFAKLDTDGNGSVSKEERDAMHAKMEKRHEKRGERKEKMFDRMDANDDGKVTKEEMAKMKGHRKGHKRGCDEPDHG